MRAILRYKTLRILKKQPPKVLSLLVYSLLAPFLFVVTGHAVTISDRAGGAIYWGGKYVNIKPPCTRMLSADDLPSTRWT